MDPLERIELAKNKQDAPKIVDEAKNEQELKEAINQQKELNHSTAMTVTEFTKDFRAIFEGKKNENDDNKENVNTNKDWMGYENMNTYDGYSGGRGAEYLRLKGIEWKKLNKEELDEYADEQWLFYQQEVVVKKNLQQSTNVITDYLQEEFEGLLSFFRIRKILPKQRIEIQW